MIEIKVLLLWNTNYEALGKKSMTLKLKKSHLQSKENENFGICYNENFYVNKYVDIRDSFAIALTMTTMACNPNRPFSLEIWHTFLKGLYLLML